MKKGGKIIQWGVAIFFWLLSLGTGSLISSAVVILAGILIAPIKPIRNFLEKIKIPSAIAIILSVILFFTGILISPDAQTEPIDNPSVTEESTTAPNENLNDLFDVTTQTESTTAENNATTSTDNKGTEKESPKSDGVGNGKKPTVSSIPKYSGKIYIPINSNIPNFSKSELTTKAYESYSPLDSLGRCGVAKASLGKEIMPEEGEKRESISSIKPSGWVQAKYEFVSGKYLYNRSHLIGWQLSAENANKRNLITGTRYMNTKGMLPFENMVADYINETGNHVAYRVTPVFNGSDLVATGVQIEAYSIEDDGDGICFNVFCYNIQPGIEIDYSTGNSKLSKDTAETTTKKATTTKKPTTTKKTTTTKKPTTTKNAAADTKYVCNTNSKKFHYPNCASAKKIKDENKMEYKGSRDSLLNQGYTPCGNCDP